jgi:hypothetical protein
MALSSRFTIRYEATPALLELLSHTTLGTNGARYRHLDTKTRIFEADNPLFLSVERDGRVQGNVTFCRRENRWYVRYFAFLPQKQAASNGQHAERGKSRLKQEIASFYEEVFDGKHGNAPEALYAYIDPKNERSKWMAEQFGFRTEAQLMTQTFSRVKPKMQPDVRLLTEEELIHAKLTKVCECHAYYVPSHAERPEFYGMFAEDGRLIAFAKITRANWVIERLPGFLGGFLTRIVPYIPYLRRIIKPSNHRFLVPESVCVENNDPAVLERFFEGMLALEERNVILWWVDKREPVWRDTRQQVHWGLLHKLTAQTPVDVVVLRKNSLKIDELQSKPIFVAGWDMV